MILFDEYSVLRNPKIVKKLERHLNERTNEILRRAKIINLDELNLHVMIAVKTQ